MEQRKGSRQEYGVLKWWNRRAMFGSQSGAGLQAATIETRDFSHTRSMVLCLEPFCGLDCVSGLLFPRSVVGHRCGGAPFPSAAL